MQSSLEFLWSVVLAKCEFEWCETPTISYNNENQKGSNILHLHEATVRTFY